MKKGENRGNARYGNDRFTIQKLVKTINPRT